MPTVFREEMTMREREAYQHDKEQRESMHAYNLEIERMQLELAKMQTSWGQLWHIPISLILLPVKFFLVLAVVVAYARKQVPEQSLWDFLKY